MNKALSSLTEKLNFVKLNHKCNVQHLNTVNCLHTGSRRAICDWNIKSPWHIYTRWARAPLLLQYSVSDLYNLFKIKCTNIAPRLKNKSYLHLSLSAFSFLQPIFMNSFQFISSSPITICSSVCLFVWFNLDASRVWITTSLKTAFVFSLIQQTFPRRISKSWTTCCKVGALLYFPK